MWFRHDVHFLTEDTETENKEKEKQLLQKETLKAKVYQENKTKSLKNRQGYSFNEKGINSAMENSTCKIYALNVEASNYARQIIVRYVGETYFNIFIVRNIGSTYINLEIIRQNTNKEMSVKVR